MSFGTDEILSLDNKPVSLDGTGCYRNYFVPNIIDLDKINSWTIPDTCQDVVSFSGDDTVVVSGKGGHYEVCYKPFVCNKTGLYKISYDYDIPVLNFYGTNKDYQHFGVFITTQIPPGGNMSTYPLPVEGNCNGTHIVVPGTQNNTPNTGSIEYEYRLQAGQTYYLWLPFMNCEDGVQRFFTFSNIKCEEQIEYPQANNLFVSTDGHGYLIPSNKWGNNTNSSYLSTSAKQYYNFSGYTSYGDGSISNNIFTYGLGDGGVKAWFSAIHYNITTANDGHGTCTCNKTTATGGETATLGNTPATYYQFNNYTVTGGSVNGSTLTVTSNCTAKANFTRKNITFSAIGNTNTRMYVTATYNGATTSWNTNSTATKSIPAGAAIKFSAVTNNYFRTKSCKHSNCSNFTSARLSDPKQITGTCTAGNGNSYVSTDSTVRNDVKWTWTFNNNSKPNWNSNNGGICRVYMTPSNGKITINSTVIGSSYCCKLLTDSNSGYWYGATARTTASRTRTYFKSQRVAAIQNNTWSGVYMSAHVAMTGGYYHSNNTWNGTATNGGQRGLKAFYLYNSTQGGDPGKNINNNFYQGTKNTTITTSFNVTGTGNNMAYQNWNNQILRVEATLGAFTGSINYDASKYPPNQINGITATVYCTAIMP